MIGWCVQLNMTINEQSLQDQFEWDVSNKENSPEVRPTLIAIVTTTVAIAIAIAAITIATITIVTTIICD